MLALRSFRDLPVRAGSGIIEIRHLEVDAPDAGLPGAILRDVRLRPAARYGPAPAPGIDMTILVIEGLVRRDTDGSHRQGDVVANPGHAAVHAGASGARFLVIGLSPGDGPPGDGDRAPLASGDAGVGWSMALEGRSTVAPRMAPVVILRRHLDPGGEGHHSTPPDGAGYLLIIQGAAHAATDIDALELREGEGAAVPGGTVLSVRSREAGADVLLVVAAGSP